MPNLENFASRGLKAQVAIDKLTRPRITRADVVQSGGKFTYRLADSKGVTRFEGCAITLAGALSEAMTYAEQIEQGIIIL
jgi:hypothetical protein